MSTTIKNICMFCKHKRAGTGEKATCEAYLFGIPDEIYLNGADHRASQPNDHGIHFEYAEGLPNFTSNDQITKWERRTGNSWSNTTP